jgi:hypothetical protein
MDQYLRHFHHMFSLQPSVLRGESCCRQAGKAVGRGGRNEALYMRNGDVTGTETQREEITLPHMQGREAEERSPYSA